MICLKTVWRLRWSLLAVSVACRCRTSRAEQETAWVCPMHPDYTMDVTGNCPRCGMALVRAAPFDVRDYRLDFRTVPAGRQAGEKATLRFSIFHPGTGEPIKKFEVVHERQYHLFVISQDMEYFQHIHPAQQAGRHVVDRRDAAKAGYYKILSDFLPGGGAVAVPRAAARHAPGYAGDLAADSARLVPDTDLTKTVDDVTATLSYDPAPFIARAVRPSEFSPDRHRDRPADHRPSDVSRRVRAHAHHERRHGGLRPLAPARHRGDADDDGGPPQFLIPPGADLEKLRGGPDVTFDGLVPKAGRYRAWTQFRRNDKVYTFAFTFTAVAGAE